MAYENVLSIKPTSYSVTAAEILEEDLFLSKIAYRIEKDPTDTIKVWVNEDKVMGDYTPGTTATAMDKGGEFKNINNPRDRYIFLEYDKNELRKTYNPQDYIDKEVEKAVQAAAVDIDTNLITIFEAEGQLAYSRGTNTITAGAFVVGNAYEILTIGTTDYTLIGASANTIGVIFTATGVGAGTGTSYDNALGVALTSTNIRDQIAKMRTSANKAKMPKVGRVLLIDPDTEELIAHKDSGFVLNTEKGDFINEVGFIGFGLGYNFISSLYMPEGQEMISLHGDGFGGNLEEIVEIELVEVARGNGKIGMWAVDGRLADNFGVIRPGLVQLHQGA